MGKLIRLKAAIKGNPFIYQERKFEFLILDGLCQDLVPWMFCGGHGTVSGISNFAPLATFEVYVDSHGGYSKLDEEDTMERDRRQAILARADIAAVPAGVRGMSKLSSHPGDTIAIQRLTGNRVCLEQNSWIRISPPTTIATTRSRRGREVYGGLTRSA